MFRNGGHIVQPNTDAKSMYIMFRNGGRIVQPNTDADLTDQASWVKSKILDVDTNLYKWWIGYQYDSILQKYM